MASSYTLQSLWMKQPFRTLLVVMPEDKESSAKLKLAIKCFYLGVTYAIFALHSFTGTDDMIPPNHNGVRMYNPTSGSNKKK